MAMLLRELAVLGAQLEGQLSLGSRAGIRIGDKCNQPAALCEAGIDHGQCDAAALVRGGEQ